MNASSINITNIKNNYKISPKGIIKRSIFFHRNILYTPVTSTTGKINKEISYFFIIVVNLNVLDNKLIEGGKILNPDNFIQIYFDKAEAFSNFYLTLFDEISNNIKIEQLKTFTFSLENSDDPNILIEKTFRGHNLTIYSDVLKLPTLLTYNKKNNKSEPVYLTITVPTSHVIIQNFSLKITNNERLSFSVNNTSYPLLSVYPTPSFEGSKYHEEIRRFLVDFDKITKGNGYDKPLKENGHIEISKLKSDINWTKILLICCGVVFIVALFILISVSKYSNGRKKRSRKKLCRK